tara:strand:+ start:6116 stop:6469 length:354 start_codon:yes stop_codon:yes gene_type:complete
MPWVTQDAEWTTPPVGVSSIWQYAGDYIKLNPLGTSYSYVTHIPMTMICLNGTLKLGIKIKDKTEGDPKPGCFETDIWEYYQYHVNRGNFTQVKGYWRSPSQRGRARMSLLSKGIKR